MLLKVDKAFYLHKKGCSYLVEDGEEWDCSCSDPRIVVNAKDSVLFVTKSNDITYLVTTHGQVGGIRLSSFRKFIWRLNTVYIKDIKQWNGEDIAVALFLLALTFAVCVGAFSLVKFATASGQVDSCIVKEAFGSNAHTGPMYEVEGHRSWRSDEALFVTKDRDEAYREMVRICPK